MGAVWSIKGGESQWTKGPMPRKLIPVQRDPRGPSWQIVERKDHGLQQNFPERRTISLRNLGLRNLSEVQTMRKNNQLQSPLYCKRSLPSAGRKKILNW